MPAGAAFRPAYYVNKIYNKYLKVTSIETIEHLGEVHGSTWQAKTVE